MKRQISVAVLVLIIFSGFFQPVSAADALHRMLHGEQDLLVLGQLSDWEDGVLEMRVIRALQGRPSGTSIQIQDDFTYAGFTETSGKPQVGDYAVLSLNRTNGIYKQAWYMARAESGHMRSLSLMYDPDAGPGPTDLKALQYYVNTNGRQKEFYFDGEKVFAKRSMLEDVDLTDSLIAWETDTPSDVVVEGESAAASEQENSGGLSLGVVLSAFMLIFFVVVIYIRLRAVFLTVRRQKKASGPNA